MGQSGKMILIINFFEIIKFISGLLLFPTWIDHSARPISSRASDIKAIEIISLKIDQLEIGRIVRALRTNWILKKVWRCLVFNGFIQSIRKNDFFRYHPEDNNERNYACITQNQGDLPFKVIGKDNTRSGYRDTDGEKDFSDSHHELVELVNLRTCYANGLTQLFADLFRVLIVFVFKIPSIQEQSGNDEGKESQYRVSCFKSDERGQKANKKGHEKAFGPIKGDLFRNYERIIDSQRIVYRIIGDLRHFLSHPFNSYILIKNSLIHKDKSKKTQENYVCGIFNNSIIKKSDYGFS
jgi:hypothetical protein